MTLELHELPSQQDVIPQYKFEPGEMELMTLEVERFLSMGIIEKSNHEPGEVISNIFCRKKKSGKIRD